MRNNQSGQGLTEYAVILSLVAVASIAAMAFFGGAVKGKIASLSAAIAGKKESEVASAEEKAQKAADGALKKASKVKGSTAITNEDTFDSEDL